jgi:hypothetical protein
MLMIVYNLFKYNCLILYCSGQRFGDRPDPEIPGTGLRRVCDGGAVQAKPDPAPPDAEKGGSRDTATIEEI